MKLRCSAALAVSAVALAAVPGWAQQEWSFEGRELLVTNLAGEVTVRGHDGSRIVVRAKPGGSDAERLNFEVQRGGEAEFHVLYPLNDSRRYVYPRMRHGETKFRVEGWREQSSFLDDYYSGLSRRDRIEIRGEDGRGALEAWADLEILVPRNVSTRIKLGVGRIDASDIESDIDLDTHTGPVTAENIGGDTRIDTSSGSVEVRNVRGSLDIDTGSGGVEVSEVEGDFIRIDTGSGHVTLERAKSRQLDIDTGSGSVRTADIDARSTNIDTGSGSVTLSLLRLDGGTHVIDTGSGSVTVTLPANASVRIHAETGSGSIRLDLPSARLTRMSRDEVDLEIGGGAARMQIDTGSGGVNILTRGGTGGSGGGAGGA